MITENYVKQLQNVTTSIFQKVRSLQKRKKKYNILNVFQTMIASSFGDNKECNFKYLYASNKKMSESTRSYWRSKIYDLSLDFDVHSHAVSNKIINHLLVNDPFKHLYERFNLLAGDLTKTKSAYRIKTGKGKNITSVGISALFDIYHQTFRSYNVTYSNNEHLGLLEHEMSKKDLIILDRYYSSYDLFNKLKKRTNFLVRLKKNLCCVKKFLSDPASFTVINAEGVRLKLVKYWIDKKTKKIILNKYANDNCLSDEDNSNCYVLATNVTDLSVDDCIYLYKKRWSIEIAFKHLKQNFRIRYPCQSVRSKLPLLKCQFWFMISFFMFNLTSVLKNSVDSDNDVNCKFAECARFIRRLLMGKIKNSDLKDDINHLIKYKYLKIYEKKLTKCVVKGTHKSVNKINSINAKYEMTPG